MKEKIISRLNKLIDQTEGILIQISDQDLIKIPLPGKWSKKQIFGHLIDSAINNLQRFTEIQFASKPYRIRKYSQEGLVNANNYQTAEISELLILWKALNQRIIEVIKDLPESFLMFEIELGKDKKADLKFLIQDYVDHMKHHVKQISA